MNPWHDIEVDDFNLLPAIIEIPALSKTKFELDKKTGLLRVDRVLYGSVHYPHNYGFIPRTYCDDHDPLDILVVGQATTYPLSIMRAKPIGSMRMIDQGELDDKIIAVHADDPTVRQLNDISDLAPHMLQEIQNFFEIYKSLEKKHVSVEGFHNRDEAIIVIQAGLDMYRKNEAQLRRK